MAGSNTKNPVGRPTKLNSLTVKKLEEAFALGCTDEEACFYADISKVTLYKYQDKHPEFINRKEALKLRPVLQARQNVVQNLKTDVKNAQWYLERKTKEFKQRHDVTSDDEKLEGLVIIKDTDNGNNTTE